jgi:hypothetical protein
MLGVKSVKSVKGVKSLKRVKNLKGGNLDWRLPNSYFLFGGRGKSDPGGALPAIERRLFPPRLSPQRKSSPEADMSDNPASEIELLRAAYSAFNARNIDAALATMAADVSWPKAFKGGFALGHESVRAYWTEQWSEIDPHVEPVSFHREDDGRILVEVHQVVRDLAGTVLVAVHVGHRFTLADGLLQAMEVCSLSSSGRGA